MQRRVLEAKGMPGNLIGWQNQHLGLQFPSYFAKVFNRYVGETPGMYAEEKASERPTEEEKICVTCFYY
ncbi:MAG: hypothetical protein ACLRSW_11375 [Christensenellaceae bacterium]